MLSHFWFFFVEMRFCSALRGCFRHGLVLLVCAWVSRELSSFGLSSSPVSVPVSRCKVISAAQIRRHLGWSCFDCHFACQGSFHLGFALRFPLVSQRAPTRFLLSRSGHRFHRPDFSFESFSRSWFSSTMLKRIRSSVLLHAPSPGPIFFGVMFSRRGKSTHRCTRLVSVCYIWKSQCFMSWAA
jgi:hypothetical protein